MAERLAQVLITLLYTGIVAFVFFRFGMIRGYRHGADFVLLQVKNILMDVIVDDNGEKVTKNKIDM